MPELQEPMVIVVCAEMNITDIKLQTDINQVGFHRTELSLILAR